MAADIVVYFVALGAAYVLLRIWRHRTDRSPSVGNNPAFVAFRRSYLVAYIPAALADWLQMPHLYKLYADYRFQEDQIAVLYVVGFLSAILFGTSTSRLADRCGRRLVAVAMTAVAVLGCLLKLQQSYAILFVARIFDGAVAAFLFSTLEAWYVHEHVETHDFPKEWIEVTFQSAATWSASLAVVGGVVTYVCTDWLSLGTATPFLLAVPCFLVAGVVMATRWTENFGQQQQVALRYACDGGLRAITSDPRVLLLGVVQSLYESSFYVFVFLWTPVLGVARRDLGLVFASFMLASSLGAMAARRVRRATVALGVAIATACVAYVVAASSMALCVAAFLAVEAATGGYFVAMTPLRARLVAPPMGAALLRVPLGVIAGVALMTLHGGSFLVGNRTLLIVSATMTAVAAMAAGKLSSIMATGNDADGNDGGEATEMTVISAPPMTGLV